MTGSHSQREIVVVQAARGLAICLVVLAHANSNIVSVPDYASYDAVHRTLIYLAMPVFFFLTGLAARREADLQERVSANTRLLVRFAYLYGVWSVLYLCGFLFTVAVRFGGIGAEHLAFAADGLVRPRSPLWYLYVSAAIQVVRLLLVRIRPRFQLAAALALVASGLLDGHQLAEAGAYFLVFILAGSLVGKELLRWICMHPWLALVSSALAFLLVSQVAPASKSNYTDVVGLILGGLGIVLSLAIWALPIFGGMLGRVTALSALLGCQSLEIYLIHSTVMLPLSLLVPHVTRMVSVGTVQIFGAVALWTILMTVSILLARVIGRSSRLFVPPPGLNRLGFRLARPLARPLPAPHP